MTVLLSCQYPVLIDDTTELFSRLVLNDLTLSVDQHSLVGTVMNGTEHTEYTEYAELDSEHTDSEYNDSEYNVSEYNDSTD
jgi:hypothetical protein